MCTCTSIYHCWPLEYWYNLNAPSNFECTLHNQIGYIEINWNVKKKFNYAKSTCSAPEKEYSERNIWNIFVGAPLLMLMTWPRWPDILINRHKKNSLPKKIDFGMWFRGSWNTHRIGVNNIIQMKKIAKWHFCWHFVFFCIHFDYIIL